MKTKLFRNSLLTVLLLGASQVGWAAACTTTLSPGANVASAVASAAGGSTICLNSGDYGTVTLSGINPSSNVTLQSASGIGAMMYLYINNSSHLIIQNMSLTFLNMWGSPGLNTNMQILNNTFVAGGSSNGSGQMQFAGNDLSQGNVISGNTFNNISECSTCYEGRLQIYGGGDLIVSNNTFSGGGNSDGIQIGGTGTTIGPGNVFTGLVQGNNSAHVDSIQLYGEVVGTIITGNYFTNDSAYIGAYSGATNITINNNVFGPQTSGGSGQIQLLAVVGALFDHNTDVSSWGIVQGAQTGYASAQNITYTNNIFVGAGISDNGGNIHGCVSGCVYNNNLFDQSANARGTNNTIGTPTFVGGSTPTTMAGYALTATSLGHLAGLDGKDLGSNYFGTGTILQLNPPTNLQVN